MSAKTPTFGDKVKLKVGIPLGQAGGPRSPGEIGVVVGFDPERNDGNGGHLAVILDGHDERLYFEPDEVTTDLAWLTPRDATVVEALGEVLRKERVGEQRGRRDRIARLVLETVDGARAAYDVDVEARLPQVVE